MIGPRVRIPEGSLLKLKTPYDSSVVRGFFVEGILEFWDRAERDGSSQKVVARHII